MLTKEQFLQGLQACRDRDKFVSSLYDLHIDVLEVKDQFDTIHDLYIKSNFTEEGQDWYTYYIYELPSMKEGPHAWEADGTPIKLDTDEDLWNFLVNNKYLR